MKLGIKAFPFFFLEKAYFYKTYSYLIIHTQNYDCFHTEKAKREK